ncbi:MAG: hypothetical protein CMF59_12585 [Leptospiraceae bacterium]|nr:hypothetical protein [Leptospiraceae bacterium]
MLLAKIKAPQRELALAAKELGMPLEYVKAVLFKESNGVVFWKVKGFKDPVPPLNFEGHWFRRLTRTVFDKIAPNLSMRIADRLFGAGEWKRFQKAAKLDRKAAIEAAGWGAFQIMGFHWKRLGYKSADEFAAAMHTVKGQVQAFVRFLETHPFKGLKQALIDGDLDTFAHYYNGENHAINKYVPGLRLFLRLARAGKI